MGPKVGKNPWKRCPWPKREKTDKRGEQGCGVISTLQMEGPRHREMKWRSQLTQGVCGRAKARIPIADHELLALSYMFFSLSDGAPTEVNGKTTMHNTGKKVIKQKIHVAHEGSEIIPTGISRILTDLVKTLKLFFPGHLSCHFVVIYREDLALMHSEEFYSWACSMSGRLCLTT